MKIWSALGFITLGKVVLMDKVYVIKTSYRLIKYISKQRFRDSWKCVTPPWVKLTVRKRMNSLAKSTLYQSKVISWEKKSERTSLFNHHQLEKEKVKTSLWFIGSHISWKEMSRRFVLRCRSIKEVTWNQRVSRKYKEMKTKLTKIILPSICTILKRKAMV